MPRYIEQLNECTDPTDGDSFWIVDASAPATDKDRRVNLARLGVLSAGAWTERRVKRSVAAGNLASAGPLDIAYSTISPQLDLATSFTASGIFDIHLFVSSASQSGYGRVTLVAYQSGGVFAGVAICGTMLAGPLGLTVTASIVSGALRLTFAGNTTITNINWLVVG